MSSLQNISFRSFRQWMFTKKNSHAYLFLAAGILLIEFIVYKILFPFPNFIPDSNSYIEAAYNNQDINLWPIGYSKFLRLFSSFTSSDTALVFFQYLLLQVSILYFLFTIKKFLAPSKYVMRILFVCLVPNPLLVHVSNYITSDALFASLSIIWFSQLLRILYQPGSRLLISHVCIILLVFTVRYNALYYPLLSIIVIGFCHIHKWQKLVYASGIILLISGFILNTLHQYKQITGIRQFSAFGGWQLASNALFAYAQVPAESAAYLPDQIRPLHTMVNKHNDSLRTSPYRPDTNLGIYYLWDDHAPLKKYMLQKFKNDNNTNTFKQWALLSPLYKQYGLYLIQKHPRAFIRHYVWPNLINYYVPPAEFLGSYNMGSNTVDNIAKTWFGYKTNQVKTYFKNKEIKAVEIIPVLLALINLLFLLSTIGFLVLGGLKTCSLYFYRLLLLMLATWVINGCFSVFASPIVLRYQLFPMIITFTFTVLLSTFIIQQASLTMKDNKNTIRIPPKTVPI